MPDNSIKNLNSFNTRSKIDVGSGEYEVFILKNLPNIDKIPFSIKILLENLLRNEDGVNVTKSDIEHILSWDKRSSSDEKEISYKPARVLMQDFTGVPAVADLAAMRDAMVKIGGDPDSIKPLCPAELVIDHSVQVDSYGSEDSEKINLDIEFSRNEERYKFLKWGQNAFNNLTVVPPGLGIIHQVNLERLARVVYINHETKQAYPDTVVGTDSHTTMINGLGVLGWGVGGIEAEAAMLGQPISMLLPKVVGMKLYGKLAPTVTATDLVLTITQALRKHGVVGKFVEFYGEALSHLTLADRATISNMAPEYGATCGLFPVDDETIRYLELSARSVEQINLTKEYYKAQGLYYTPRQQIPHFDEHLELDLSTVKPCLSGPKRPQDLILLNDVPKIASSAISNSGTVQKVNHKSADFELKDGAVVIAAITSCTNTSNPYVMIGAALLAKKAVEKGLTVKPWVKTSLAPGSKVVTEYLNRSGLLDYMNNIGFNIIGYGCTTCIGNSGPLDQPISDAINSGSLNVASVLSGNRNFEGRVHPEVKQNYLASPPLVVAYALAGNINIDWDKEPVGKDSSGKEVFLKDIFPTHSEVEEVFYKSLNRDSFAKVYEDLLDGGDKWKSLSAPEDLHYSWENDSTYVRQPPFFDIVSSGNKRASVNEIKGAYALVVLGDSVTTDHISPAGSIKVTSPAGKYLQSKGVSITNFNSYGSRRGNHEVMVRGTFANIRLRNKMVNVEGGQTNYVPENTEMTIYDAAVKYEEKGLPVIVIAGKEYGSGSSRDWAAKGPKLLGVKAVIAESFERIHRTNLVGMGILPLQFNNGENAQTLGLTGFEVFNILDIQDGRSKNAVVEAHSKDGNFIKFTAKVRIDTPKEIEYYQADGILPYVLSKLKDSNILDSEFIV